MPLIYPNLDLLHADDFSNLENWHHEGIGELKQLPDVGSAERVRLVVYPGGHMFYSEDASRAAFREAVSALYRGP